jgi:hypothetical protein
MAHYPLKAIKITAEGEWSDVEVNSLKDLQEAVGGYIEPVRLEDGSVIFVNEEGKNFELPHNRFADDVALACGGIVMMPSITPDGKFSIRQSDWIAGDVIIVGPTDAEGESLDVTDWVRRRVQRVAADR